MVQLALAMGLFFVFQCQSYASGASGEFRDGVTLGTVGVADLAAKVTPGTVIVLGEQHGTDVFQSEQLEIMKALRANGMQVSVGMEFLNAPDQPAVDDYRAGRIDEVSFLQKINWTGFPFQYYRDQILFPSIQESTVALNVPRSVTGVISQKGLGQLSAQDLAFLPPNFLTQGRGNDRYFERFKEVMSAHVTDPLLLDNYFWAQSAWDDTMAWHASDFILAHPQQILVIVVGEFHVQYGGGLPDRLRKAGLSKLITVSMINTKGLSDVEKGQEIDPQGIDGARADFLFLAEF